MRCDDRTGSADDRDASVINGIYAAGMILHAQLGRIDNGKVVRHVQEALGHLDEALREIRWAALVRRRATGS